MIARKWSWRRSGRWAAVVVAVVLIVPALATGVAARREHVIRVASDTAVPRRLVVERGDVVVWRRPDGGRLRVEFDPHPLAHEYV